MVKYDTYNPNNGQPCWGEAEDINNAIDCMYYKMGIHPSIPYTTCHIGTDLHIYINNANKDNHIGIVRGIKRGNL